MAKAAPAHMLVCTDATRSLGALMSFMITLVSQLTSVLSSHVMMHASKACTRVGWKEAHRATTIWSSTFRYVHTMRASKSCAI